MKAFFRGVSYLFDGFSLLSTPGLRRFVVLPLLANIAVFVALFFTLRHYTGELSAWVGTFLPVWLQWLDWLLNIFFFTGFAVFFVYAFATLANLIACPFNGIFAEHVEMKLTGVVHPSRSMSAVAADVPRVIGRQFGLMFYYLPRAFCIVILFFVPVVNVVAAPLWFLFNAWFMAMQYLDYPTDNHHTTFAELKIWLSQHRWACFGFGLAVLVALMLPLINFFAIPAAVAGATALFVGEGKGHPVD